MEVNHADNPQDDESVDSQPEDDDAVGHLNTGMPIRRYTTYFDLKVVVETTKNNMEANKVMREALLLLINEIRAHDADFVVFLYLDASIGSTDGSDTLQKQTTCRAIRLNFNYTSDGHLEIKPGEMFTVPSGVAVRWNPKTW